MKHIVDVREKMEFMLGHVKGAVNIPLTKLNSNINVLMKDFEKEDEIILYCMSGHRANVAMDILKKHGFTNIVNGMNKHTVESKHL